MDTTVITARGAFNEPRATPPIVSTPSSPKSSGRRPLHLLATTALCAAAMMSLPDQTAQAATYKVTSAEDDGSGTISGSLSWAIANAASDGDVIEIDPGLSRITVSGTLPGVSANIIFAAVSAVEISGADINGAGKAIVLSGVSTANAFSAALSGGMAGTEGAPGSPGVGLGGAGGNGGAGGAGLSGQGYSVETLGPIEGGLGGRGGTGTRSSSGSGGMGGSGGAGGNAVSGNSYDISNSASITGGAGGGGGTGGTSFTGQGGKGGDGGNGGNALSGSDFALTNTGTIVGGAGGAGGTGGEGLFSSAHGAGGDGGTGGVAVSGTNIRLNNSGTITGGAGGRAGSGPDGRVSGAPGMGSAGISGSNIAIVNSGTIAGGLSGDGSVRANAIEFTSGTNSLELQSGSSIIGNVVAGGSADTLVFGGDTSPAASFALTDIGTKYTGFEAISKTGGATWTLSGIAGTSLGDVSVSDGILDFNGATATADFITVNGGTLKISNASQLSNDSLLLGTETGKTANVVVTGTGSSLTLDDTLSVGSAGAGTLSISDGGQVSVAGQTVLASIAGSQGTLNIGAAAGEAAVRAGILNARTLTFGAGSGTLVFNHTDPAYLFAADLNGKGTIEAHAGTTILTGNNSAFTGSTVVNGGTLRAGGANAFANNTRYLINGGTLDLGGNDLTVSALWGTGGALTSIGSQADLTIDQDDVTGFSGEISGLRNMTKTGFGTLFLRGNTAISGTLGVDEGIVSFGGGKTLTSGSGAMAASGSRDAEFEISGAGTSWTIGSGLRLGAGGGSGNGNLWIWDKAIVSAATLDAGVTSGAKIAVSGAGSKLSVTTRASLGLDPGGHGTVVLSDGGLMEIGGGAGSLELGNSAGSSGTLVIGGEEGAAATGAGILRAGAIDVGSGTGKIVFNHTEPSYDFSTAVRGGGELVFLNGETTLSGDYSLFTGSAEIYKTGAARLTSNYTGAVGLHDGVTYTLDTTLAGGFTVNNGAQLNGTGTIGGLTLRSGATLAPGNSIGTINVAGDVSFATGSIYAVEVDGTGGSDLTAASGKVLLSGGTVDVSLLAGSPPPYASTTSYTILTGADGVFGTFDGVTESFAFLDAALFYGAKEVTLELKRNNNSFLSQARTANQRAVATSLDSPATSPELYKALIGLDQTAARAAYDGLSGEIHASLPAMFLADSARLRDAVTARIQTTFSSVAPQTSGTGPEPTSKPLLNLEVWGQIQGTHGRFKSDGNAATLSYDTGGGLLGLEARPTQDVRFGVLAGFGQSHASTDARSSSASVNNYTLGTYGAFRSGPFGLGLGASYTWHEISTSRHVAFGGLDNTVTADYWARTAQAFAEASYKVDTPWVEVEPFAGLAVLHQTGDAFQEQGSAAVSLTGKDASQVFGSSNLGVRLSKTLSVRDGVTTELTGTLGWQHAIGSLTAHQRLAIAGLDSFSVQGVPIDRNAALVQAGLRFNVSDRAKIGLSYLGRFAGTATEQGANARLDIRF